MKGKRNTALVLMLALLMSLTYITVPAPALADQGTIEQVADELSRVYPYWEEADKQDVREARSALDALADAPNDGTWDEIVGPLLTSAVQQKLGNNARQAIIEFMAGLAGLQYSTSRQEVLARMTAFNSEYVDEFRLLFGNDFTMNEFYQYLSAVRERLRTSLGPSEEAFVLAFGQPSEVADASASLLKEAMVATVNQTDWQKFKGKLGALGWSVNLLADQEKKLANVIDPNYAAQMALAMGYMRSETDVEGDREVTVGDTLAYTVRILGRLVYGGRYNLVGWGSSNESIIRVTHDSATETDTLAIAGPGTATLTVYRDTGDYGPPYGEREWIARFDVVVRQGTEVEIPQSGGEVSVPEQSTTPVVIKPQVSTVGDQIQATLPNFTVTSGGQAVLTFPADTKVTAPADSGWDGTIQLPFTKNSPSATVGGSNVYVMEVGAKDADGNDIPLTFDKPVRLLLPNQKGKTAAFIRKSNGQSSLTVITRQLTADSEAAASNELPSGGDGYIDVGNDKAVWTKHFTEFVAYTPTPQSPSSDSGSGGGGGAPVSGTLVPVAAGGTVTGSGAKVEIPANAFGSDVRVTITRVSDLTGITLANGQKLISDVIDITKDKSGDFLKPVTLTLPFDKSKVDLTKQEVGLYWYDAAASSWKPLDNVKVDVAAATVSGQTLHFTKFAVLATDKLVTPPPIPVTLTDIKGHWAEAAIVKLVSSGAIAGYPDKTFKPDKVITRGECATVLVKALNLTPASGKVFADTKNHWARDYIATAAAHGIVSGHNQQRFGPDDAITREQLALMLVKAKNIQPQGTAAFSDSAKISSWAQGAVAAAVQAGIMSGYPDGSFKPKNYTTRAEAATAIVKLIK